jgi:hypothetical protein
MINKQMREMFKPWATIGGKELVSYAWPQNGKLYINARTIPGDPTTMHTFEIVDGKLNLVDCFKCSCSGRESVEEHRTSKSLESQEEK